MGSRKKNKNVIMVPSKQDLEQIKKLPATEKIKAEMTLCHKKHIDVKRTLMAAIDYMQLELEDYEISPDNLYITKIEYDVYDSKYSNADRKKVIINKFKEDEQNFSPNEVPELALLAIINLRIREIIGDGFTGRDYNYSYIVSRPVDSYEPITVTYLT